MRKNDWQIRDINRIVKTYNRNIYVDVYLFPPLMKWRDSSCIRMQTFANNTARESRVEHTACKSRKYHTAQQVRLSSCHGCRSTDPRPPSEPLEFISLNLMTVLT